MNRRGFLGAAVAGVLYPASGAAETLIEKLSRAMPLEERIRRIQQFVHENYYDSSGLLYSHVNFQTMRPHLEADLADSDPNNLGIPPHDHWNYENSSMNSGVFLAGQCYRYLATKDPQALVYAAKAFGSLDANYKLAEAAADQPAIVMQRAGSIDPNDRFAPKPGWICKPYGGMLTTQTSTEQNFGPIWGLYLYRQIAPPAVKRRVDAMIAGVADLWYQIGYRINFFGETWEFEKSMPRAQRHMPVWSWVNRVAYEVTGERRFQREFQRLDALFGAMPTAQQTNFGMGRRKYISTEDRSFHDKEVVIGSFLCDLEPQAKDRYLAGMANWWKFAQIGICDENFYTYYSIELDTVTSEWRPLPKSVKPRQQWNSPSMWQNGTFPVCWGEQAARLAVSSAMLAHASPAHRSDAVLLAKKIFACLDREQLRYMKDPQNSLDKPLRHWANILSGDTLAYYPTAYWYGRYRSLWS